MATSFLRICLGSCLWHGRRKLLEKPIGNLDLSQSLMDSQIHLISHKSSSGPHIAQMFLSRKNAFESFSHTFGASEKKNNKIVVCLFFLLRRKVRNLWLQDFFWITLAPTTLQSCTEVAVYLGFCVAKTCLQIWNAIFAGFFLQLVEIHKGDNRQSEHKHLRVKKALDCVALWGISSSFQLTESVRPQVSWQTYKL